MRCEIGRIESRYGRENHLKHQVDGPEGALNTCSLGECSNGARGLTFVDYDSLKRARNVGDEYPTSEEQGYRETIRISSGGKATVLVGTFPSLETSLEDSKKSLIIALLNELTILLEFGFGEVL